MIFSDFIAAYKYRKEFDLGTLKLMVPFAAIGIIIGSLTFSYFSEDLLKFIIGLMGFLFAGHYFFFKKNKEAKSEKNFLKGGICSQLQVLQVFVFMLVELRLVFIYFHLE